MQKKSPLWLRLISWVGLPIAVIVAVGWIATNLSPDSNRRPADVAQPVVAEFQTEAESESESELDYVEPDYVVDEDEAVLAQSAEGQPEAVTQPVDGQTAVKRSPSAPATAWYIATPDMVTGIVVIFFALLIVSFIGFLGYSDTYGFFKVCYFVLLASSLFEIWYFSSLGMLGFDIIPNPPRTPGGYPNAFVSYGFIICLIGIGILQCGMIRYVARSLNTLNDTEDVWPQWADLLTYIGGGILVAYIVLATVGMGWHFFMYFYLGIMVISIPKCIVLTRAGDGEFPVIPFVLFCAPLYYIGVLGIFAGSLAKGISEMNRLNTYEKMESDTFYVTDYMGNTRRIHRTANGGWQGSDGRPYVGDGRTFTCDGRTFHRDDR